MVNNQSVFGRVLDQLLEERDIESVEALVSRMSEDDRRAIVAHAIRAAAESPPRARHPMIAASLCRALSLDTNEKQMPLLYSYLEEEEYCGVNPFGETLAEILKDRGLTLDELAERADLDADELREAATDTDPYRMLSPRMIPAVAGALDLSEEEANRLRWPYYMSDARSTA